MSMLEHVLGGGKRMAGVLIAIGLAAAGAWQSAQAQTYPSRPVRMIVAYPNGGLPDVMGRMVAQRLTEQLGQQVIVENRPGAAGLIAIDAALKAEADGHTLMVTDTTHYALNPVLRPNLPYVWERDFAPVTHAVSAPLFLAVNAGLGVNSVQELVALAKTRPGMNFGSPGSGSAHHLGLEQFALLAGIKLTHVPYKGVALVVPALLAGDIQLMLVSPPAIGAHVKSGKVRVLGVASAQRTSLAPELPTVAEAGYPGYEAVSNIGFVVRAATPRPLVARLNTEIVRALRSPEVEPKLPGMGAVVEAGTSEQYGERMRQEQARFVQLLKQVTVKLD